MPWSNDEPPKVATNWTQAERERCTNAANKHIAEHPSDDAGAIFACIAAAGKSKKGENMSERFIGKIADAMLERLGLNARDTDDHAGPTLAEVHIPAAEGQGDDDQTPGGQTCGTCRQYNDGSCALTGDEMDDGGKCEKWEVEQMSAITEADGIYAESLVKSVALLNAEDEASDEPERFYVPIQKDEGGNVLVFPVSTFYRDGKKREFTAAQAQEMVANFKSNILERKNGWLPVNAEHERWRGRIAHVTDMTLKDGVPYATLQEVEDGALSRFDYISPEIHWDWQHPYTGEKHKSVLMGIGATNYPFLLGKTTLHAEPVPIAKSLVWDGDAWEAFGGAGVVEKPEPEQPADSATVPQQPEPFTHEVPIANADSAQRIMYAVVLQPGEFDAQGHRVDEPEVEAACHRFTEKLQLDNQHKRLVQSDEAKVVENWIQREPVRWQYGEAVTDVLPGSWCMAVKFYSDELWADVVEGRITGLSPRGWGVLTEVDTDQN